MEAAAAKKIAMLPLSTLVTCIKEVNIVRFSSQCPQTCARKFVSKICARKFVSKNICQKVCVKKHVPEKLCQKMYIRKYVPEICAKRQRIRESPCSQTTNMHGFAGSQKEDSIERAFACLRKTVSRLFAVCMCILSCLEPRIQMKKNNTREEATTQLYGILERNTFVHRCWRAHE